MFKEAPNGSNCIGCEKCEEKCPQGIEISIAIKDADKKLNETKNFTTFHWYNIDA